MSRSLLTAFSLAVLALAVPTSALGATPTCFGKSATHVMQPGGPTYFGTPDDDVVVGTAGPDQILLADFGGTDVVCGGGGNDRINLRGADSKADGGAGRDTVEASEGGLARGGSGDDAVVQASGPGGRAEGGSGSDELVNVVQGATADGGSGDDIVQGFEATALYGGSGSDRVANGGGDPKIDCGAAYDVVLARGATDVRRCERDTTP